MKYPVYSYRDEKTGFGSPIVDMNEPAAVRGFSYAVNTKEGLMNFVPGDFGLYRIGTFDTESGVLTPETVPVLVVSGSSVAGA